jgi:hypothetical protein
VKMFFWTLYYHYRPLNFNTATKSEIVRRWARINGIKVQASQQY